MKTSEPEVREMLRRSASEFSMDSHPEPRVLHRARRRRSRNWVLAGAAVVAIGAVGVLSLNLLRAPDRPVRVIGHNNPSRPGTAGPARLVTYVVADTETDGSGTTLQDLRDHAACMRAQGFDVPDPTVGPDGSWRIEVENPQGFDPGSQAFREAMFVTCGPLGGPLSGSLRIVGSQEMINGFVTCMQGQGFDLPEPTLVSTSGEGSPQWELDLTGTDIDTSTPAWNQALFATCSPDTPPWFETPR
jgi:hypothetical protein